MTPGQIQTVSQERVYPLLHSRPEGLSAAEVRERLSQVGPNRLQSPRRFLWTRSLVRQFVNFFSLLLDLAAFFCFVAERMQPGGGLHKYIPGDRGRR